MPTPKEKPNHESGKLSKSQLEQIFLQYFVLPGPELSDYHKFDRISSVCLGESRTPKYADLEFPDIDGKKWDAIEDWTATHFKRFFAICEKYRIPKFDKKSGDVIHPGMEIYRIADFIRFEVPWKIIRYAGMSEEQRVSRQSNSDKIA